MDPAISLKDVTVSYPIGNDDTLRNFFAGLFRRKKPAVPTSIHALRGVSLDIRRGERVGIIGRNGAGKSTLLRVMGGLFPATTGEASVTGRVAALIGLGQGFDSNANGWDNIRLRSLIQGATQQQIREKTPEIAEFTGLGDFLDVPVRCYSSGMYARLGFAIATAYDPDILLVDEVLGAGDEEFQARARARMEALMAKASLLVMVSHSLNVVTEMCSRAICMKRGRVALDGDPNTVVGAYRDEVHRGIAIPVPGEDRASDATGSQPVPMEIEERYAAGGAP